MKNISEHNLKEKLEAINNTIGQLSNKIAQTENDLRQMRELLLQNHGARQMLQILLGDGEQVEAVEAEPVEQTDGEPDLTVVEVVEDDTEL